MPSPYFFIIFLFISFLWWENEESIQGHTKNVLMSEFESEDEF